MLASVKCHSTLMKYLKPCVHCLLLLQNKFPGDLSIAVDKLEGKSLRQQAALYYNTSIVIQTHGAALGEHSNHAIPAFDPTKLNAEPQCNVGDILCVQAEWTKCASYGDSVTETPATISGMHAAMSTCCCYHVLLRFHQKALL